MATRLDGLVLIRPTLHRDERGYFLETFRDVTYADLGMPISFVQDNQSRSRPGTIRGLHYQETPGQAKLVRVARGAIFDVVVDLRASSETFGSWEAFRLDDKEHLQLFVPIGFAHGFCALTEADVVYRVSSYYDAGTERGIAWDDPDLALPWPAEAPSVSPRDAALPSLAVAKKTLPEW